MQQHDHELLFGYPKADIQQSAASRKAVGRPHTLLCKVQCVILYIKLIARFAHAEEKKEKEYELLCGKNGEDEIGQFGWNW